MKTNTTIVIAMVCVLLCSCEDNKPIPRSDDETSIRGTATVQVDAEIVEIVRSTLGDYAIDYPQANVTYASTSARDAVRNLMGGLTKGIVIAREYLPDEDSAMKGNKQVFPRTLLARDALVFYANKNFPYDTMSSEHIVAWFSGKLTQSEMKGLYPKLNGRLPSFVVPSGSSLQANVQLLNKGRVDASRLSGLPSREIIRKRIVEGDLGVIGVGYLSQFNKDSSVKLLRLSYNDSAGTYQQPRVVHAANLIRGMYPFPVPIYFILKDTPSQYSLTSGVMQYLARDAKAQKKFFDAGIEPAYARIELILPD